MGIVYWAGTTDNYQTVGNWSTSAVPVDDDIMICDARSVVSIAQGTLDSESGATGSGALDAVHIKSGFSGSIGTAAEPWATHADKIIIEGSGTYHILCGKDDQSTDANIDLVVINNSAATVYLYSNANDAANLCQFTSVVLKVGTLILDQYTVDTDDTGCYVKDLYIVPTGGQSTLATVTMDINAYDELNDVATNVWMHSGTLTCDSMLGTVVLYNGTITYGSDLAAAPETDLNITELLMYGGTFNWHPDDSGDDAYIGKALLAGGTFDATSTTNNDRAKVLGAGADNDIIITNNAVVNIKNNRSNITIASGSKVINLGGTFTTDLYTRKVTGGVDINSTLAYS